MEVAKDIVLKLGGRQVALEELLEKAGMIAAKRIAAYFKQQDITFERTLRIEALRSALRIPVAIRRKENANLLDKVYQRLSWFSVLSETQLVNYLEFFNHAPLNCQYVQNLWLAVCNRMDTSQLSAFGRFILSAGEDFKEIPDIIEYNERLNPLFYDLTGQLDGLTPAQLRAVLYNSSTIIEIKQLAAKYGIKVPGTINKPDLLKAFMQIASARGLLTADTKRRAESATVKEIEELAAQLNINVATKLNKEGIIEYLLQKAPQISHIYSVPLSDGEYEMSPPEDDVTDEEIAAYNRSSREFAVSQQLEFLLYLPAEKLTEFLRSNGIRFERRLRIDVLRRVLSPAVLKRSRERTSGLDRTYARLQWFTEFGETQLTNTLLFFNNSELKVRYQLELLSEMIKALSSSGAYDDELQKLNSIALENVSKNGGKLADIEHYNSVLNEVFYDEPGRLDGLAPNQFRSVKFNSSTVKEIGDIAAKFGVNVPDKLEREDLAALIIEKLKKDGKNTAKEEDKIQKLPFRAMIGYAKNMQLDIELGLNKEELIEFVLKSASQTASSYTPPKSAKQHREATPPHSERAEKLLAEHCAQQRYTIVFERLGGEMFFDNDESYVIAAGEVKLPAAPVAERHSAAGEVLGDESDSEKQETYPENYRFTVSSHSKKESAATAPEYMQGYVYIQTGYEDDDAQTDETKSVQQSASTDQSAEKSQSASEFGDGAWDYAAISKDAGDTQTDGYDIIAPQSDTQGRYAAALSQDADYAIFYMDEHGNTVSNQGDAAHAGGSVTVQYHSQKDNACAGQEEDIAKLMEEIRLLRFRYDELAKKTGEHTAENRADKVAATVPVTHDSAAKAVESQIPTCPGGIPVSQTDKKLQPADTECAAKPNKKGLHKKGNRALKCILWTLLIVLLLGVAYTAITYFVDIPFLASINDAINSVKVNGEGFLKFLHGLMQKLFKQPPAMT